MMMKTRLLFTIVMMVCLCIPSYSYNDYRNAGVDSLEALLNSDNPPKDMDLLHAYEKLTVGYLPYDSLKTRYYAKKAIDLSFKLNELYFRQSVLRTVGLLHYGREEYDSAMIYFNQALEVTDVMKTDKRYDEKAIDDALSALYGTIGNAYNLQDKTQLAIHYYQLALPIFERYGWLESLSILYYNIGELFQRMGNDTEAEKNFQSAMQKAMQSTDSLMVASPAMGLANIYIDRNDYVNALSSIEQAALYYRNHKEQEISDYCEMLATLARINLMEGHVDLAKADVYVSEALACLNDEMMFDTHSDVYATACEVAMARKQWNKALDYALKSIHPDSLATYADKDCYLRLAQIYTQLGQKDEALRYMNKTYEIQNRYATDSYQSGLSQMEIIYETEKKDTQIATLARERHLHLLMLGLAAGLLVLLVGLILYMYIAHRRQKALIASRVALEAETKERRMLARDMHDSLGGMLSLLRLKIEGGAGSAETLHLLDQTSNELRRVSHHLMPEELLQGGLRSSLQDFAISVPGAQFHYFGDDNARLDQELELVLYRCAYELINNALKHSGAQHIDIQLMQDDSQVVLTVSDDGCGITEHAKNTGMGLQNVRDRIKRFGGKMEIISTQGTEINVTIPL